jgi:ectoine hydroxylase-related dioxygenase (phytanoyl-CoA dioxygenase family)
MSQDQYVFLDEPYPIEREHTERYAQDGCILLGDVLGSNEVGIFRKHIERAVEKHFEERKKLQEAEVVENYNAYFTQVTNLWEKDESVKQFVLAKRFARIAAELMGVSGVRLYHDQALFKEPGGLPTPWHQDQFYWPLDTTNTITMWMPLVDVSKEMGSLKFAVRSHADGPIGDIPISEESNSYYEKQIEENGYEIIENELKAGDATFHAGWTIHAAAGNDSSKRREVMTVIYYADGTRVMQPDNKQRQVDMEAFHPGIQPGEYAASPLNPLLYSTP